MFFSLFFFCVCVCSAEHPSYTSAFRPPPTLGWFVMYIEDRPFGGLLLCISLLDGEECFKMLNLIFFQLVIYCRCPARVCCVFCFLIPIMSECRSLFVHYFAHGWWFNRCGASRSLGAELLRFWNREKQNVFFCLSSQYYLIPVLETIENVGG